MKDMSPTIRELEDICQHCKEKITPEKYERDAFASSIKENLNLIVDNLTEIYVNEKKKMVDRQAKV